MKINRKSALAAVCATSLVALSACGSDGDTPGSGSGLKGQQLVYVNFGGDSLTAAKTAWLDPFMKETGVSVATDSPSDPAKVKAMVAANNTTWDVIDLDAGSGAVGCGTLYEKRSAEVDTSHIDPRYMSDECGVPIMVQTLALVYNTEKFGDNPPTKITDFMDTARFPGKRITLNYAVGGLEGMLLADGVPGDQLFPLDLDRAKAAVQRLGDDLSLQSTLAQQGESLESGDFAMCFCYVGRAALNAQRGAKVDVVWDAAYSAWDALYAIKGSKSPEAQQALLNYIAQPDAQARFTEELPYGPTTPESKPDVAADLEAWLPQNNESKMGTPAFYDAEWWKANTDKAFAAWTEMTAG
ncbi:extracellular solute-binding protein [Nocardioides aromaticivorans]|nr:extracellular solute-binding protein [Nocardioides aromaticivorans]